MCVIYYVSICKARKYIMFNVHKKFSTITFTFKLCFDTIIAQAVF